MLLIVFLTPAADTILSAKNSYPLVNLTPITLFVDSSSKISSLTLAVTTTSPPPSLTIPSIPSAITFAPPIG